MPETATVPQGGTIDFLVQALGLSFQDAMRRISGP